MCWTTMWETVGMSMAKPFKWHCYLTFRTALQCFLEIAKFRALACDKWGNCPLLVQGGSESFWKSKRVISREDDDAFLFCDWKRWSAILLSAVGAFLWLEWIKLPFLCLAKQKERALDVSWILKRVNNGASGVIHVEYSRKWWFMSFFAR